jgi:Family of unknown function (DUF5906)
MLWDEDDDTFAEACRKADERRRDPVSCDDFFAYMPQHNYIFAPTRDFWPATSINARLKPIPLVDANGDPVLDKRGKQIKVRTSDWLDQHRAVEQATWSPGERMLIRNRLICEGGFIDHPGCTVFNLYRAPVIEFGDAAEAYIWRNHIQKIFPDDVDHIVNWLAHRVQFPEDKLNHALVLGGAQGIGKDTLLEPVKHAVGDWNFLEVSPHHLLGRFNGYVKSVILRINEARDLGDMSRFSFYDHMKALTAAPPNVLRVDEKHRHEYYVPNCTGIIITTNHKSDGIFLPSDDRRHYVAWSDLTKENFTQDYWSRIWSWYADGGHCHVAAYLAQLDLSSFDAKAPPPKTAAFWDIVDANRAPEDAELADVLDILLNPKATTLSRIQNAATGDFQEWLNDRKNRRTIPHRMEKCGYVPVRNDAAKDGLWKISGRRQVVYAKAELSLRDRFEAARKL